MDLVNIYKWLRESAGTERGKNELHNGDKKSYKDKNWQHQRIREVMVDKGRCYLACRILNTFIQIFRIQGICRRLALSIIKCL